MSALDELMIDGCHVFRFTYEQRPFRMEITPGGRRTYVYVSAIKPNGDFDFTVERRYIPAWRLRGYTVRKCFENVCQIMGVEGIILDYHKRAE